MARTIKVIYDALISEKEAQPELDAMVPASDSAQLFLNDLNSPSRVARWRHMLWVVAVALWVHEKLWDAFRAEIDRIVAGSHVGTIRWYVEKAKAFQYGYDLTITNNVPLYAEDVPSSRIIARAAGKENGSIVLVKVAKLSGTDLVPLSTPELEAFDAYIDEVKMAGTVVNVISALPDLLKVGMSVYYDPLVMAADGTLILDPATRPVDVAIHNYLANLPFNGFVVLTSLVDAVQQAIGVVNPVATSVQAKHGFFPYSTILVQYETYAGHLVIDPANDLTTTITYLPHVV